MRKEFYEEVRKWMYLNARNIDLCLWKYFFEDGNKDNVLAALMEYQNEDGGFGHALEADNWNPESSPITTEQALIILKMIDFFDMSHPVYKGIWKYLNSEKDLNEYGWSFTIPANDKYPHASWWSYSEERNKGEFYGITASFSAFIIQFGDKNSELYKKSLKFTDELFDDLFTKDSFGNMGLEDYIKLIDAVKKTGTDKYDFDKLTAVLKKKVKDSIEYDTSKWPVYGVRPSNYINSPDSIFYEDNAEIMDKEVQYLLDTKPHNDVWPITWTWYENMDKYSKAFDVSENWWKGFRAVEYMIILRNFKMI